MSDGEHDRRWLTYRELAEATGLSLPAAEARARRHIRAGKWRHRQDNEPPRTARVLAPTAALEAIREEVRKGKAEGTVHAPLPAGTTLPAHSLRQGDEDPIVDPLRAAIQERDATIAALREGVAERDATVAELRQTLALREAELAGAQDAVRRADDTARRADAAVQRAAHAAEEARQREGAALAEAARLRMDFQQGQGRAERLRGELSGFREAVRIANALAERESTARQAAEAKLAEARHLLGQTESAVAPLQHASKLAEVARREAEERAMQVEALERQVAEAETRAQAMVEAAATAEQAARDDHSAATTVLRHKAEEAEQRAVQAEARAATAEAALRDALARTEDAKPAATAAKREPGGWEDAIVAAQPRRTSAWRRLFGRK
jgi:hypothetical protein